MRTCVYNLQFEQRQKQNACESYEEAEKVVKKYSKLIDEAVKNCFCPRLPGDKCLSCDDNVKF